MHAFVGDLAQRYTVIHVHICTYVYSRARERLCVVYRDASTRYGIVPVTKKISRALIKVWLDFSRARMRRASSAHDALTHARTHARSPALFPRHFQTRSLRVFNFYPITFQRGTRFSPDIRKYALNDAFARFDSSYKRRINPSTQRANGRLFLCAF